MRPIRALTRLLPLLLGVTAMPMLAQAETPAAAHPAEASEAAKLTVVVMRHGVRSPTQKPEKLDALSQRPWPRWSVAPGRITAHGDAGLKALGARYRQLLATPAAIAADCRGLAKIEVITDSDNRNHASAGALLQGMAPGCEAHYRALPEGQANLLFRAVKGSMPSLNMAALDADTRQRLQELQQLLDPARAWPQDPAEALQQAGGLAENLMLEYAEGMPLAQVGWGQLGLAGVQRLIALHNVSFDLRKRVLPAAAGNASNLTAHLLASLQAAAGATPQVAALAAPDKQLVFVIGHDTNLANLAGLFDLDWASAAQPDHYPPGGGLAFELVGQGLTARVRVRSLMPSLEGLRANRFDQDSLLHTQLLPLAACDGALECPLTTLSDWLQPRLQATRIESALPPMQAWSVP